MDISGILDSDADLRSKVNGLRKKTVFLGFDAFVDKIVAPILSSNDKGDVFFPTIKSFGQYISEKDGINCSIELNEKTNKLGGNMPITANAISGFGIKTSCVGAFGFPEIENIFTDMDSNCMLYSVGNPGYCVALEFDNGKVMLSMNQGINGLDWETIKENLPLNEIVSLMDESDMLCFLNWGEMPKATGIFEGILSEVLPKLSSRKKLFIDFSDFSRRSKEEIKEIIGILKSMSKYTDISLSLNSNEKNIISDVLEINEDSDEKIGFKLMETIGLDTIIFHNRSVNMLINGGKVSKVIPTLCEKPVISTGAGDNFNAGYCVGILLGLENEELLTFAVATAKYYLINGKSFSL